MVFPPGDGDVIESDVAYEKADREVTARFAGDGVGVAVVAAVGAISWGANGLSIGVL